MNLTQCIKGGSRERSPGWLIAFQYDVDAVEHLKRFIPHTHREWRDIEKIWWISEDYEGILKQYFNNFEALAYLQSRMF